ncbi:unnamed protein product [Spirodela intermedia]|uniref:Uncharacterized protein n=1 Tax=Spirodela intermedia TaxID=51605 RepID=A0A7I8KUS2_SPIIN|nr:unnamed protein product [Spirodela intermedia]
MPKLSTSALTVISWFTIHSEVMYPLVPLAMETSHFPQRLKPPPRAPLSMSLDIPKSASVGLYSSSRRMFWGFTSQCRTHSRHSSCR